MSIEDSHSDDTETFAPLSAGSVIGHYEIIKKLGGGGMGQVYLGRDRVLDRQVALKFLSTQYVTDNEFRERFFKKVELVNC